jgi:hypothetical protein
VAVNKSGNTKTGQRRFALVLRQVKGVGYKGIAEGEGSKFLQVLKT